MTKLTHLDELEVEKRLIQVLGEDHNQWTYRPDLKSEADLWQNLRQKINQNNQSELNDVLVTDKEFEMIKTELLGKTRTPFDAGKWLKGENGQARITIDREDLSLGKLSVVLFTNDITGGRSSYEVVNQIAKQKVSETGRDRRFDVTLLINGLPIVQIELKQVSAKDGYYQAFNQIKKYAEEGVFRGNIFSTLQVFVISNEQTTRYFANALPSQLHRKFIFSWRTSDNRKVDNLYEFAKQMLNIPDAHRLITDYTIVSEEQDNKVLMVLHPYQIHAIEALYTSAMKHQSGYVWHATGSGKTITSFVSTKLLARKAGIDRTIMLIDRKDLDDQTTSEFTKFASEYNTGLSSGEGKSNSLIVGTGSAKELSDTLLADANSNVVIVTTRQKLDAALKHAEEQEKKNGKNRFEKLKGQHIVFVVDECHRALSAEGMAEINKFFVNATWFGFTGTPIFEVNKKQAKGQLARTTGDQYGEILHTYTIKNALEDGSVLGFQVEHETTIEPTSLDNYIFDQLSHKEKYQKLSAEELNHVIDQMSDLEKETYLKTSDYETDAHIQKVITKILKPDNAYTKFDFQNGKPQKSAILTTNSIAMAKKYYHAIKELTQEPEWLSNTYSNRPLRTGRVMDDPDFPRIAVTYSLEENAKDSNDNQQEMIEIIKDYNGYYQTAWTIDNIDRYNGDINNRLARKKGEFKQFGNHLDLVIVVNRLLTGFDAPTVQTLFVDKDMTYANLIQAFSRTNRTYPDKTKGMIVTYRKPATMEVDVANATKLYSEEQEQSELIYPKFAESKKRFEAAFKAFSQYEVVESVIDEQSPIDVRLGFVKAFQELNNSFEALVTYDEYNVEYGEASNSLKEQVSVIEENLGVYNSVKGSIVAEEEAQELDEELSQISFYSDHGAKIYDIDSTYINRLLDSYSANSKDIREEIEQALKIMNKSEIVRSVYQVVLDDIDSGKIVPDEDILVVKRHYFTAERDRHIHDFSKQWFVSESELHTSAVQFEVGMSDLPNIKRINDSRDFDSYKEVNPDAKPFRYLPRLKRAWQEMLEEVVVPLNEELR